MFTAPLQGARWHHRLPQHITFMTFCIADGCSSVGPMPLPLAAAPAACPMGGLTVLMRLLLGRWAVELWNCACVEAVGVVTSAVKPPGAPPCSFCIAGPDPLGRSRAALLTPGLFGEGGRGCWEFKRKGPGAGPRWVLAPPARTTLDGFWGWFVACKCCDG